ncbi:ribosome small subunit-dependent GTPase A [Sulfitobacter guttiformis]|uniref:Small ribosomal subunit biogenesis GTPase RsgA n=1 Tax=Sulfitobacter guttiformis TaxID=74349 RepID=A0A420DUC8_9RHOB|nr:ribosome small subunit-dependent GTPase A [Sulfitobacter guttiformis]KIN71331.1 putative ribosome biogenesis GTPase RsgA [Sulfitobacter guttiformis KCTC 32187]RKE97780.1 ribosome biogenesis GTPase [Sulfitobacter guttiformis]
MPDLFENSEHSLAALGWSPFFEEQRDAEEAHLVPLRIATVHRARMSAQAQAGRVKPVLPHGMKTTDFAVGDWVLADPETGVIVRRLERHALLQRKTDGSHIPQLIAANVDTLFIVTSCNDDFNPARLERYLALANEAQTNPVIVLTKADKIENVAQYVTQAAALQRGLEVVTVNAKLPDAATALARWCGAGQTVALVGSSGVGKSTLLNTLADKSGDEAQLTGGIREGDAKGRHTTTSRSLHEIAGGGWVIDTPGIRTLHVSDLATGLDVLFAEITELTPLCKFRDCTHAHEPGCAVLAAVKAGILDSARVDRWRKLSDENAANTPQSTGARGNKSTKTPQRRR